MLGVHFKEYRLNDTDPEIITKLRSVLSSIQAPSRPFFDFKNKKAKDDEDEVFSVEEPRTRIRQL